MPWITQAESNIGGREEQQDRYLLVHSADGRNHLLVVADGAGGHSTGAAAAQAAIDCIRDSLSDLWSCSDPQTTLHELIDRCNQAVLKVGGSELACTTLVLVLIREDELFWGHVGDSRFYIVRDGDISFKTNDHSLSELQQQTDTNKVSLSETSANGLYMCLGALDEIDPEVSSSIAKPGDILLLCSDGLWGQVDIQALVSNLSQKSIEKTTIENWVDKAKQAKGEASDNITLVAAKFLDKPRFWQNPLKAMTVFFSR